MKKQFLTAAITVIFAVLIATGCSGKNPAAEVSGENHTVQATNEYVADISADGTDEAVTKEPSVTESEVTYPEGQTEKETAKGQTVPDEAQTDEKGETMTEGEEQQTKPSAAKPGTTTTQPETEAPTKAPAQSTVKPEAPAQSTPKPTTPVQSETQAPTKAPAQSTPKPTTPAQSETQAPTKAPAQSTPKPTAPTQPETQAPTKAPEKPKEKTMWDAPYDVEAIKAYMVAELKARGYEYLPEVAEKDYDSWVEEWGEESAKENYNFYCNLNPESAAWDNFCTATAGPNRYYDNVNHCTVGHQHYNWSSPATGAGEKKNSDGLTSLEFKVNDAIGYWDHIYGFDNAGGFHFGGPNGGFVAFTIYTEKFDDGCVIFYILA